MGDVLQFAAVMTTLVGVGFTAWIGAIMIRRWEKGNAGGATRGELAAMNERLARMEQMMDVVAVEVERMAEGQRFTARLLAEREGQPAERLESGAGAVRPSASRAVEPR